MNSHQKKLLAVLAANVLLVLLFPPFDSLTIGFGGGAGRPLMEELSRLGQLLAERFDQEDALIRRLHMPRRRVA